MTDGIQYTDAEIEASRQEVLEERLISLVEELVDDEFDDHEVGLQGCELRAEAKRRLKDLAYRVGINSQYIRSYQPGTYDCHEVITHLQTLMETLNKNVLEHDTVIGNPLFYREARKISVALFNLINVIGLPHLARQPNDIIEQIIEKIKSTTPDPIDERNV